MSVKMKALLQLSEIDTDTRQLSVVHSIPVTCFLRLPSADNGI